MTTSGRKLDEAEHGMDRAFTKVLNDERWECLDLLAHAIVLSMMGYVAMKIIDP